jgi:hypothetical protein
MKRTILAALSFLSLTAGGCAAIDGNFVGGSTPSSSAAPQASKGVEYEPMSSQPPAAMKEEQPSLEANQVWVPGYYQPVAGNWIWHQGSIMDKRDGYTLLPASYREDGGKVYFSPPKWRRNDLVAGKTK